MYILRLIYSDKMLSHILTPHELRVLQCAAGNCRQPLAVSVLQCPQCSSSLEALRMFLEALCCCRLFANALEPVNQYLNSFILVFSFVFECHCRCPSLLVVTGNAWR